MKFCLLTYHARFVCRDKAGFLFQGPENDTARMDEVLWFEMPAGFVQRGYIDFVGNAPPDALEADIPGIGTCAVRSVADGRFVTVDQNGLFLSAAPEGGLICDRAAVGGWEMFLPCSEADLITIRLFRENRWIVKSTRELVPPAKIALAPGHELRIGNISFPLGYNLPFEAADAPFRFTVLIDGWRIEEVVLFKPLIYYVAFGDGVFDQLRLSLRSLVEIGRYGGQILVFTDRSQAQLCAEIPQVPAGQLRAVQLPATEWVGFVAGKYCILEDEAAYAHQPVAYMDPDIIYNTSPDALLAEMAVAARLSAPIEDFSALANSPSVGATLLQLDHAVPRFACGFNGGTIGIPNLPKHQHTLRLIRRVIENILAIKGRTSLTWVDQEVANYVSYKIAHFDLNQVSRFVRYGAAHDATAPGPRTGIVHFWNVPRVTRVAAMAQYLDVLMASQEDSFRAPQ